VCGLEQIPARYSFRAKTGAPGPGNRQGAISQSGEDNRGLGLVEHGPEKGADSCQDDEDGPEHSPIQAQEENDRDGQE